MLEGTFLLDTAQLVLLLILFLLLCSLLILCGILPFILLHVTSYTEHDDMWNYEFGEKLSKFCFCSIQSRKVCKSASNGIAGADPGWFLCGGGGGVHLIKLPYSLYVFGKTGLNKQCSPDQAPQNAASDQGLHCLPLIQQFYTHWICWRKYKVKR